MTQTKNPLTEQQAKELISEYKNVPTNKISIEPQKGGLFNHVLKATEETTNRTWYLKQYLDKKTSTIFNPPEIPAARRADLAYKTQKLSYELNQGKTRHLKVCDVENDQQTNTLIVEGVPQPTELIYQLQTDTDINALAKDTGKILGQLHTATLDKTSYQTDLYKNTKFRDFKLELQYEKLADHPTMNEQQSQTIRSTLYEYKNMQRCVLHGDINSRNIITSKTHPGGIIDFEQAHLGHPAYDLAYILSEIHIAAQHHNSTKLKQAAETCLAAHSTTFSWDKTPDIEQQLNQHLPIQILYRFLGPSHKSWTSYITNQQQKPIIQTALSNLNQH